MCSLSLKCFKISQKKLNIANAYKTLSTYPLSLFVLNDTILQVLSTISEIQVCKSEKKPFPIQTGMVHPTCKLNLSSSIKPQVGEYIDKGDVSLWYFSSIKDII